MSKGRLPRLLFPLVVVCALAIIGRNVYRRYLDAALLTAVETKNVPAVRALLAKGANPNTRKPHETELGEDIPLLYVACGITGSAANSAAKEKQTEIACLLVEHGANVREKWDAGLLNIACNDGNVKLTRALLEHGADANALQPNSGLPMDCAIARSSRAVYPHDPQKAAAEAEQYCRVTRELARLLQAHGARVTLHQWIRLDDLAGLRAALEAGAAVDAREPAVSVVPPIEQPTPLQVAVDRRSMGAVRLLLEHGANVNAGSTLLSPPLLQAITHKDAVLARLLLAHGADPNAAPASSAWDLPALASAVVNLPALVPELLRKGANVNGYNAAALKAAILRRDRAQLRVLLQHGADVNQPLSDGSMGMSKLYGNKGLMPASLLMNAACFAPECVTLLQQAGAKIGSDKQGILAWAAQAGHADLFPRLLALGANVNGTNKAGETALCQAVLHAPSGVAFLLEHGANPNQTGRSQSTRTPLCLAVLASNIPCTRLLLQHGADVNAHTSSVHTPLYYARKHKDATLVVLLQHAGGKEE